MKSLISWFAQFNWFKWMLSVFAASDEIPYSAADFCAAANRAHNRKFILALITFFWLYAFALLVVSYYFLSGSNTLFNVTAKTETVQIRAFENAPFSDWMLNNAIIDDECGVNGNIVASGTLSIDPSTEINIHRIASGSLFITLDAEQAISARIFNDNEETISLGNCTSIELGADAQAPLILPIDGVIKVGMLVQEGLHPQPVLLEGNVSISDKAIISQEYYSTHPRELRLGDTFTITDPSTQSSGFIRVFDGEALNISFNGLGETGKISRFRSEPIYMQNSIWSKITNDETIAILWVSLLVVFSVIKIMIRLNLNEDEKAP